MPIYEFACNDCGNQFERIQTFSDTTAPTCPSCDSSTVARQLSRPAIHFKGSGWYITDSKNAAKNPAVGKGSEVKETANGTEKSSEPAGGESSEPKSDVAPDTKSSSATTSTTAVKETA